MAWVPEPDDEGRLYPSYDVLIRRNSDRLERVYHMASPWHSSSMFWWADGNGSCDCNRSLDFDRAGGADPDVDAVTCGDEAFTVVKAIFPDGTELAIDSQESR